MNKRSVVIRILSPNWTSVDFIEEEDKVGTIDYLDKSVSYINSACDNWVAGIMSRDTVCFYKTQLEFDFDKTI